MAELTVEKAKNFPKMSGLKEPGSMSTIAGPRQKEDNKYGVSKSQGKVTLKGGKKIGV